MTTSKAYFSVYNAEKDSAQNLACNFYMDPRNSSSVSFST